MIQAIHLPLYSRATFVARHQKGRAVKLILEWYGSHNKYELSGLVRSYLDGSGCKSQRESQFCN